MTAQMDRHQNRHKLLVRQITVWTDRSLTGQTDRRLDRHKERTDRDVQRKSGPPHNPQALEARAPKAIDEGALSYSLEGPGSLIYGFEAPTP